MNIVYLIGNGFDLNLGMRTKYEHFYEDYLSRYNGESTPIKEFCDFIAQKKDLGIENWSDVESAIGEYLGKPTTTVDGALALYDYLIGSLEEFITKEEKKCPFDTEQKDKFFEYLKSPHLEDRLLLIEKKAIDAFMSTWKSNPWSIRLITFNYTKSIERIIGDSTNKCPIQIGKHHNVYSIELSKMEHIHGFANDRMILGVNDISQISSEELKNNERITDSYVKSNCNSTYGLEHDEECQQWIKRATLICLFGLSFGATDKKWWEIVGETLKKKDCRVIIFEYNDKNKFNGNQGSAKKAAKEAVKNKFLSQTGLDENLKAEIKKKIYVAYNSNMFKLDIGKRKED